MSLMEDIYLEDEAVDGFERVIEGDEDDNNRVESENESDGNKEDEAEEDKRKVDPTKAKKKEIKNPRITLNPARLTGPRGIHTIQNYFPDFKFQGKGRESEDLDMILKKLEHWAHRLYPKFQFDDCLEKIETLGKKRAVMTQVKKIRFNLLEQENDSILQKDSSDDEGVITTVQEPDEFDKLLEQQIAFAKSTPATVDKGPFGRNVVSDSPRQVPNKQYFAGDDSLGVSRLPQTPAAEMVTTAQNQTKENGLSEDQKQRMLRNRMLAEERRLARMKKAAMEDMETYTNANNTVYSSLSETITINTDKIETRIQSIEELSHVSKDFELNMADCGNDNVLFDKSTVCEDNIEENGKLVKVNTAVMDLYTISEEIAVEKMETDTNANKTGYSSVSETITMNSDKTEIGM